MSNAASALIEESLPSFLANYENPRTQSQYERAVRSFLAWFEGTYGHRPTWKEWTVMDTRAWRDDQLTRYSPATINVYLMGLKQYVEWAITKGLLTQHPLTRVKRIRVQTPTPRALTNVQITALERALYEKGNAFHRILLTFMLHTGLRANEVVNVRLDDITLGERRTPLSQGIPVRDTRVGFLRVVGKGYAERTIPLNLTARLLIMEMMELRPKVTSPYLFISPQTYDSITPKNLNSICSKLDDIIPGLHPHLLRDTFATRLQRKGVPIEIIAKLLGHADIRTTARYYLESEALSEMVERIADDE